MTPHPIFKLQKQPCLIVFAFILLSVTLSAQTSIRDYVVFGGKKDLALPQTTPPAPGYGVQLGASTNIHGGSVGSYHLVKTTGAANIGTISNPTNIYSGGLIQLFSNNVVTGKITAANQYTLPSNLSPGSTIFTAGTGATLGNNFGGTYTQGNIDVNGSINIGISGSSVLGKVTIPPDKAPPNPIRYTYSGPVLACCTGGVPERGTPNTPTLPVMPDTVIFPSAGSTNITSGRVNPGFYNNLTIGGNATVTLAGPGTYVFNSITSTGPNSQLIFDFISPTTTGNFIIYVYGNVVLNRLSTTIANAGSTTPITESAKRIYTITHGKAAVAWDMSNGSNGISNIAVWLGTIYAPFGAITLGTPTGPSSFITGALWSSTQVNVQGSTTLVYAPFPVCVPPNANAGPDKPLNIDPTLPPTTLTGSSTTPGVTFSWQALNGGVITSPSNTSTITVSEDGTYVLTVYSDADCFSRDTVVVTNPIGDELKSVYLKKPINSSFFIITPDEYIMIDIIMMDPDDSTTLVNTLKGPDFGLRNIKDNGASEFIITGEFPIANLPKLNFVPQINYCRPFYEEITHSGVVTTVGDTSLRSWLVRNGYDLDGKGVKIGVISNSYNTITDPTVSPFKTNTAEQDVANGDLPGPGNPDGHILPVHILKQLPGKRSDEGRGMLQIIHDLAPAAELYFRTGSETAGDFAAGIVEMYDSGCHIIVDDLTYITEQFLTDGVVAKAVDYVTSHGTTYFSAAGNFGRKSYESKFDSVPAPPGFTGTAHDFDPTPAGVDIYQKAIFEPGKYIIVLQWVDENYSISDPNQPKGTKIDLDFFTTHKEDGTDLSGNNRINLSGDAIEIMTFTLAKKDTMNFLIVNKTPGTLPKRIKLVAFRGGLTFDEYNTAGASTIVGQANAAGAIAIGAARYNNLDTVEYFSSAGGTTVFTKSGIIVNEEIRNKPELVGADGVNTTVKLGLGDADGDSYYNFFGTSAAAPHAAGVAALIMQARKKFLGEQSTPTQIKDLLTSTATDMLTANFDFASGYGLINADSALRKIAAPTPSINQLIVPTGVTPGQTQFTVTVKGFNLSYNSVVYFAGSPRSTNYLNNNELTATIPVFTGNPAIQVYTPPNPNTILVNGVHLDGGFSNSLYFGSMHVTVIAKDTARKYAEVINLVPTVLVDGKPLDQTNPKLTLRDLGLQNLTLTVPPEATNPGKIGSYKIGFSQAPPTDQALVQKYSYEFIEGTLTVQKLPVKITVQNMSVEFGTKIPNPTFTYEFDGTNIPDDDAFLSTLKTLHQSQVVKDVLGLVNAEAVVIDNGEAVVIENGEAVVIESGEAVVIENGEAVVIENLEPYTGIGQPYIIGDDDTLRPVVNVQSLTITNGFVQDKKDYVLNNLDIANLSFLVTPKSLQNTRVVNSNTIIDITQESILDFNKNAAQTQMTNSVSSADPKGLVDVSSYTNGEAVVIENGEAVVIESGEAVVIESAEAVVLESGEAVVIENGEAVVIDNGEAVVIENAEAVVIENGEAVVIDNADQHYPYRFSDDRTAVIVNENEVGRGISALKSLNVITGLTIGNHFLIPGALTNNNLELTYVNGIVSITDPCPILTRKPNTGFNSTTLKETGLWVTVTVKISRQLAFGDSLFFTGGKITFNNIEAYTSAGSPITSELIPNGVIVAKLPIGAAPKTRYENNRWITEIPIAYSSTSDIFISATEVKSNKGFKKLNGGTTVVQGKFYSNICNFSDQWTYAMAAYQPSFDTSLLTPAGKVASVNGAINGINYRAGAPIPFVGATTPKLVSGGSGGGGNNYTGSSSSYENFTACPVIPAACSASVTRISTVSQEETQPIPFAGEVQIMPNPATNYITLSFVPTRTGYSDIVLFNIDGRKVFETNNGICEADKRYVKDIDVSKLINGVYIVQLRSADKTTVKKIIINR